MSKLDLSSEQRATVRSELQALYAGALQQTEGMVAETAAYNKAMGFISAKIRTMTFPCVEGGALTRTARELAGTLAFCEFGAQIGDCRGTLRRLVG